MPDTMQFYRTNLQYIGLRSTVNDLLVIVTLVINKFNRSVRKDP